VSPDDVLRHGLTIATGNDRDFRRPGLKGSTRFKQLPWDHAALRTSQLRKSSSAESQPIPAIERA